MVHNDAVHGASCVVLTLVLVLVGMPLWLVVTLPLVAYAGQRLIAVSCQAPSSAPRGTPPQNDRAAYASCVNRLQEIWSLSARLDDAPMRELLQRITERIDLILHAMTEDDTYRAAPILLGLLNPTRDLLASYLRVVERKLGTGEGRERVLVNIETLDAAYARFWERLNRSDVVGLAALNDTIDFYLDE